jgi:rubrerythrin
VSESAAILREGCRREREQTLFYRALVGEAERAGDAQLTERLNELLADEQHHVARLTARILERGEKPEMTQPPPPSAKLMDWLADAEGREAAEVAWYEHVIDSIEDTKTAELLREILESERNHLNALGGKWMSGEAPTREQTAS